MNSATNNDGDLDPIALAFNKYFEALKELKRLGVLPNSKDFTSQLGEWLVATLFDGDKATNGIQKDWDVKIKEKLVQVKTHAKASTTPARWSRVEYGPQANIDELVIIVFSDGYRLKEYYTIPWTNALPLIRRNESGHVIMWNDLGRYKIDLNDLPKQSIISVFK